MPSPAPYLGSYGRTFVEVRTLHDERIFLNADQVLSIEPRCVGGALEWCVVRMAASSQGPTHSYDINEAAESLAFRLADWRQRLEADPAPAPAEAAAPTLKAGSP